MYKRLIFIISIALFSFLAFLAGIITDLYDREFPQSIDVNSKFYLDFSESGLTIPESYHKLEEFNHRYNLGLLKETPDLTTDGNGQSFILLSEEDFPSELKWFRGEDVSKILGKNRLMNSYPDGLYLVTGENKYLDQFEDSLIHLGINVSRMDASVFDSLQFIIWEKGFLATVLAVFALIVTLGLFWLSIRARGRALRVLGGSSAVKIQIEDLIGFGNILLISAGIVTIFASVYIGLFHGWLFVDPFLNIFVRLEIMIILLSLFFMLVMSLTAWPRAYMLATRQPPVRVLRHHAAIIQLITFLLMLTAAWPAWSSYKNSTNLFNELAQWRKFSDQVAIVFATDGGIEKLETEIGQLIIDAEELDTVAFSYTYMKEMREPVDFGEYLAISYVNNKWINLVTANIKEPVLSEVNYVDLPDELKSEIHEEVQILSRNEQIDEVITKFQFYRPVDGFKFPVAQGGGGERLDFFEDVLLILVPSLYETYNNSALTSMVSSSNITFSGAPHTQQLLVQNNLDVGSLRERGLNGQLNIVYIAENGLLQAQFAEYVVWLLNLALVFLIIAFTIASVIGALITSILHAKRDFPLQLAGLSAFGIVKKRVLKEVFIGIFLVVSVMMIQKPDSLVPTFFTGIFGLLVVPTCHILTTQWCFDGVIKRRI